jgi:hypothetical protein
VGYKLRMKYQDQDSLTTSGTVYYNFDLTIRYECNDDVVTVIDDQTLFSYSTLTNSPETFSANNFQ